MITPPFETNPRKPGYDRRVDRAFFIARTNLFLLQIRFFAVLHLLLTMWLGLYIHHHLQALTWGPMVWWMVGWWFWSMCSYAWFVRSFIRQYLQARVRHTDLRLTWRAFFNPSWSR